MLGVIRRGWRGHVVYKGIRLVNVVRMDIVDT